MVSRDLDRSVIDGLTYPGNHAQKGVLMVHKSLEDVLQSAGNPVKLLRNSKTGPYVYPVVPAEFTNWRDEQQAWQKTCVLYNQSYHMTDMYVQGPDGVKLFSALGINSFKTFD